MLKSMELNDDRSEKVSYNRPDYPVYIRRSLLSDYPGYTASNHWHNDLEFIAVLSGEMDYNVNGEIIRMKGGEGIFVNAGQMHFGFSDRHRECDFLCILLHPILLCASISFEQDFILPVIRSRTIPYIALCPAVPWQNGILDQLHAIYASMQDKTMPLKVQAAFAAILGLLYEQIPPDDTAAPYPNSDLTITKNMVGFIQKNYTDKIVLADIAAAGAVGQSKCCRLFSQYFKQTPVSYLNQYRLNKSLELLHNTDLSITEIALSVGFNGASYYAETFRKWIGKSPTRYRNGR